MATPQYRKAASAYAAQHHPGVKYLRTVIGQHGREDECRTFMATDNIPDEWHKRMAELCAKENKRTPLETPIQPPAEIDEEQPIPSPAPTEDTPQVSAIPEATAVKVALQGEINAAIPIPLQEAISPLVKESLPAKKVKPHKGTLPNGRSSKRVTSFEDWHCRVFPIYFTYPAWRSLSGTAKDVGMICKAKFDHAAHLKQKDSNGKPMFDFTVGEAESFFKMTRPSFTKAIRDLLGIGFLEYVRPGGLKEGKGIKALYTLSESWKKWQPPQRDNSNIDKAREKKNQNRSKATLTSIGKDALNRAGENITVIGKAAFNDNPYFPV